MSERYDIKAKLGEGGAGTVYRAWDTQLNRTVAIKRLLNIDGTEAGEKLRKELLREASLLSAVQHPNICQVYDFGVDEDGGYVVMEFVNGENFEEAADRRLDVREFCALAEQVLEGVSEAHQRNILHRDLKPSNILINWLPNALFQVKILDFGLAKFSLVPAQQTIDQATQTAKGSVHFMAPEQFEHRPLAPRTDIYSLGCLFYLLLTGKHPFVGATMAEVMTHHLEHRLNAPLEQLRPDVPPELAQWVGWLMHRQPANRPQSALEALEVLRQIASQAKAAQAPTPAQPSPPSKKTEPIPIASPPAVTGPAPQPKTAPIFIQQANEPAGAAAPAAVARETQETPNDRATVILPSRPPFLSLATLAAFRWRSKWLPAAIGLGVIVVAALFWAIWRASRPSKQPTASAVVSAPTAPPTATLPPQANLVVWLDAGHGTLNALGTKPASGGDEVDHWSDRANQVGGSNPALYHTITNRQDLQGNLPTLRLRNDGGLAARHPVLAFDGKRNRLVVGRGRGGVTGEPFRDLLKGDEFTCMSVARVARKHTPPGRLIAGRLGEEPNAWGISYGPDEAWHSGIRSSAAAAPEAAVPDAPGAFRIVTCVWKKSADEFRFHVLKSDGTLIGTESILRGCRSPGPIREIRLGANSPGNAEFFAGDMAEILLYHRALTTEEVKAAEEYLLHKYFR